MEPLDEFAIGAEIDAAFECVSHAEVRQRIFVHTLLHPHNRALHGRKDIVLCLEGLGIDLVLLVIGHAEVFVGFELSLGDVKDLLMERFVVLERHRNVKLVLIRVLFLTLVS